MLCADPIIHAFSSADGSVWASKSIQHLGHFQGCLVFANKLFASLRICAWLGNHGYVGGLNQLQFQLHALGKPGVYV